MVARLFSPTIAICNPRPTTEPKPTRLAPQALHRTGFSGGPLRQQGVSVVPQWQHSCGLLLIVCGVVSFWGMANGRFKRCVGARKEPLGCGGRLVCSVLCVS